MAIQNHKRKIKVKIRHNIITLGIAFACISTYANADTYDVTIDKTIPDDTSSLYVLKKQFDYCNTDHLRMKNESGDYEVLYADIGAGNYEFPPGQQSFRLECQSKVTDPLDQRVLYLDLFKSETLDKYMQPDADNNLNFMMYATISRKDIMYQIVEPEGYNLPSQFDIELLSGDTVSDFSLDQNGRIAFTSLPAFSWPVYLKAQNGTILGTFTCDIAVRTAYRLVECPFELGNQFAGMTKSLPGTYAMFSTTGLLIKSVEPEEYSITGIPQGTYNIQSSDGNLQGRYKVNDGNWIEIPDQSKAIIGINVPQGATITIDQRDADITNDVLPRVAIFPAGEA